MPGVAGIRTSDPLITSPTPNQLSYFVPMYVCIYVCMYMYKYVCMYVCIYVCVYVCMYVGMYVCICMYACVHLCTILVCIRNFLSRTERVDGLGIICPISSSLKYDILRFLVRAIDALHEGQTHHTVVGTARIAEWSMVLLAYLYTCCLSLSILV